MKIKFVRDQTGNPVLNIIPQKEDNYWELSEFYKWIDKAIDRGTILEKKNDSKHGDIIKISIKYE